MKTSREITTTECPWLDSAIPKNTIIYPFNGCTYGCISQDGQAVSLVGIDVAPFVEIPRDAIDEDLQPPSNP